MKVLRQLICSTSSLSKKRRLGEGNAAMYSVLFFTRPYGGRNGTTLQAHLVNSREKLEETTAPFFESCPRQSGDLQPELNTSAVLSRTSRESVEHASHGWPERPRHFGHFTLIEIFRFYIYDSKGDTVYLEELLSVINSDPNLPPSSVCEINVPEKVKSSCEDPP
ncbi:hypothetical protein Tco_1163840 [Tanacetum coccineum]